MSHDGLTFVVIVFTNIDFHLTDLHLFAFLKNIELTVHYKLDLREKISVLVITGPNEGIFMMHDMPTTLIPTGQIFQMENLDRGVIFILHLVIFFFGIIRFFSFFDLRFEARFF
jgi:hypothetical protein|tara:strand:- start:356 stop:697 length:342 start_codon:yes stop_codon:yes gene_type:complete